MRILSFSELMQLILSHTGTSFSEDRLKVWVCNETVFGVYDRGNFHKSVKSNKPLTKKIYDYYEDSSCITFVAEDVEEHLLSRLPSVSELMEAVRQLVLVDDSVLPETKEELLSGTDGEVISKVLRYAVIRQSKEKADASPDVEHLLEDVEVPKRTEVFIGRRTELEELTSRLDEERRVTSSAWTASERASWCRNTPEETERRTRISSISPIRGQCTAPSAGYG